ncbi:uncharacterized protein P174DRAFT_402651 [Aspergillus novofumigatus IBT 16806]|uniref:Glycosyltransferase 2 n=1 Tax=Aspergillus novofumigatus (strain IBT 16806) TaxID=1392255 RepID=A0A2I1CIK1_ASPN1|nr:uncharacterized protein P174DRAFT_402651 [Aspergillus novofumigatus IBT 16806]PKX97453.1 hypothetical protein P174DRAFT_402651 [Aspergillus novofumigatus IBT 16806]
MLPSKRPYLADEELGKKDDDHRPRNGKKPHSRAKQWRAPRPRRLIIGIIILYLVYLFFKNMPTDVPPAVERFNPEFAQARQGSGKSLPPAMPSPVTPAKGAPPRPDSQTIIKEDFYYEGEVRFNALARTLQRFWKPPTRHGSSISRAVVFAGSNLRSVSDLLPLACRMADQKINEVHFVLMGRDDVSIEGIQRVNGIKEVDCPIVWHDSRPDYAQWSTETRMERAVTAGLDYVHVFTRAQVLITQGDSWEDRFFTEGVRRKISKTELTHIALPTAARYIMWMSMLDCDALKVWNDVHIEILIQAPSESSGSLIRLIRSLEAADYLGSTPSLTIELPPRVDPQLLYFLQKLKWPPQTSSTVTLRRRIQPDYLTPVEASLRTVEAFYPRNPNVTHVLLLAQEVELAPSFYHFLKYTALKYKHSAQTKRAASKLLGISLELPSSRPTDDEPFTPPKVEKEIQKSQHLGGEPLPVFLWQAPNSHAALYFGDGWADLHSFLADRLALHRPTSEKSTDQKSISKRYPAVMEYLLELIRARGYYLLYPTFPDRGTFTLATVHSELSQPPEEFLRDDQADSTIALGSSINQLSAEKPLDQASTLMPLLERFSLTLPDLSSLPLLSYRGEEMSDLMYSQDTEEYAKKFAIRYGACRDSDLTDGSTLTRLFCLHERADGE